MPKICPMTLPVQCLHHENSQSSKVFFFFKKTPRSFKSAFKNTCDFSVELPGLAIAVLPFEGLIPGDASGRYLIVISICFLHFLFVLLTDLSLWVVSRKSGHLGFCVSLSWAAAISFMQIRRGPSRGSWLVANKVRGG